jgi:hypothetical protein
MTKAEIKRNRKIGEQIELLKGECGFHIGQLDESIEAWDRVLSKLHQSDVNAALRGILWDRVAAMRDDDAFLRDQFVLRLSRCWELNPAF